MFKLNLQHSRNLQNSTFTYKNASIRQDGYNNIESPMKAAFLNQVSSPHQNYSPMKLKLQQRMISSRSPKLPNKRNDGYSSGAKPLSPFGMRIDGRNLNEEGFGNQRNISFTNLIRKNSSTYQSPLSGQFSTQPLQPSMVQNHPPSERNCRQDTNLFKKLAFMLESNKKSSVTNGGTSQNSFIQMPQSCKNKSQQESNKKLMFKNVATIQSIQSPQDFRQNVKDLNEVIETKCYLEYEKDSKDIHLMQKKQSNKKRIPFSNQKRTQEKEKVEEELHPIDFHLTNSFGNLPLKNKLGVEAQLKKKLINPFEQIQKPIEESNSLHSITKSVQGESVFASLQMLLQKVQNSEKQSPGQKYNESINISIASDGSIEDLDMSPFIGR